MNKFLKHFNCLGFAITLVLVLNDVYFNQVNSGTLWNTLIGILNLMFFVRYSLDEQME
jgi:hypothetical protein